MKHAILLSGYTTSIRGLAKDESSITEEQLDRQFQISKESWIRFSNNQEADVYVQCWNDDPYLIEYLDLIRPVDKIISSQSEIDNSYNFLHNTVPHRIFCMNRLYDLIKDRSYDMVMWRRFDLIFNKNVDLDSLNTDKIHLLRHMNPETKEEHRKDYFHDYRVNDWIVMSGFNNMLKILNISIDDVISYWQFLRSMRWMNIRFKYPSYYINKGDFHYILCSHLRKLSFFDNINYFMDSQIDVILSKKRK